MRDHAFFAHGLARFGDAPALIDEAGRRLSYRQLAAAADEAAERLGGPRTTVALEIGNTVDSIVAYLGALRRGHAVMLLGESAARPDSPALDAVRPHWIGRMVEGGPPAFSRGAQGATAEPHPDLALLLPTSGSTGGAKLVRLSYANLQANAEAIGEYLRIDGDERAVTSLPLAYSYGLSVLHSHMAAGAVLLVTDRSVVEPEFWDFFRRERGTSVAGVPYSYDLFEKIGLRDDTPPTLRVMTQAGGRLAPDLVRRYARWGERAGVRFYAMYGQTEAAPRMAYLPPEQAIVHPDCVGVPIPGGAFRLIDEDGAEIDAPEVTGELVYSGPNVMMGYATVPADLGRGADHAELRTGDLAQRTPEGLYRITGRASRFLKVAGLRIGLDDLENMLAADGYRAVAGGGDAHVVLCVEEGDPEAARRLVADRCALPADGVVAFAAEAPRLPSGKIDHQAIRRRGEELAAEAARRARSGPSPIRAAFARALGRDVPDGEASFAELGGDSLSYVTASIGVSDALGHLPRGWETMSVARLEALRADGPAAPAARRTSLDSEVLCRVMALALVILGHGAPAQTEWLRGGALVLFALAGYNLARFQQQRLVAGEFGAVFGNAVSRIVLPYLVLMLPMLLASKAERSLGWILLGSVFTVDFRGPLFAFWFIETIVHALAITSLLFLVPGIRRWSRSRPFDLAIAFVAGAALIKLATPFVWSDGKPNALTVDAWLYAYMIGWAAHVARTGREKVVVLALVAVLSLLDWGLVSSRPVWFALGMGLILFAPRVAVPGSLSSAALLVARSSYFIYLTHVVAAHFLIARKPVTSYPWVNAPLLLAVSIVLGSLYALAWRRFVEPWERALVLRIRAGVNLRARPRPLRSS